MSRTGGFSIVAIILGLSLLYVFEERKDRIYRYNPAYVR